MKPPLSGSLIIDAWGNLCTMTSFWGLYMPVRSLRHMKGHPARHDYIEFNAN
ncbi:hypothetical protein [Hymenobacter koreensis]|uniref:Uncharacterized protein n=1 Tax=Hymenobacter koreensis TaxID=1084523 RepID=A0ABP8JJW3_9BACT